MSDVTRLFAAAGWAEAGPELNRDLLFGVVVLAIWLAAFLVVAAKNFRLTMKRPPQKRGGLLYGTAVGIIFVYTLALALGWVVGVLKLVSF